MTKLTSLYYPYLLTLLVFLYLVLPSLAFGQGNLEYTPLLNSGLGSEGDFTSFINNLYFLSIGIASLLAVIKITIAGVKWMLSDVVTDKSQAKKDIWGSLVGLLIIISAVLVLNIINPQLTEIEFEPENLDPQKIEFTNSPNQTLSCGGYDSCTEAVEACEKSTYGAKGVVNTDGTSITCTAADSVKMIGCQKKEQDGARGTNVKPVYDCNRTNEGENMETACRGLGGRLMFTPGNGNKPFAHCAI